MDFFIFYFPSSGVLIGFLTEKEKKNRNSKRSKPFNDHASIFKALKNIIKRQSEEWTKKSIRTLCNLNTEIQN